MKIVSSTAAAQSAVSGFAGIEVAGARQQADLGSSTVAGMKRGVTFANRVVDDVSELVAAVRAEADRVVALASKIEARDKQDASGLGDRS